MTVAMAAPLTPICSGKMNTASRITLRTAPMTMENMAYLGLPSARIMELMAPEIIINGRPMPMIHPYSKAYGRSVSVAPNSVRIGLMKIRKTAARTMLTAVTRVTALPMPFLALSTLPSPSLRLKKAAPPLPIIIASARAMMVMGNTTLVAPLPRYPTPLPMKI